MTGEVNYIMGIKHCIKCGNKNVKDKTKLSMKCNVVLIENAEAIKSKTRNIKLWLG